VATKKYISPDSFIGSIRDNLRKITGQYWYTTSDGNLVFGDVNRVSDPRLLKDFSSFSYNTKEIFGRGDVVRTLNIKKVKSDEAEGNGYIPFQGYGVLEIPGTAERSIVLEVFHSTEGDGEDAQPYQTLTQFTVDVQELFKNPGEGYFFEESFQYEFADAPEDLYAYSDYHYLNEKYENLSNSTIETALPNFYAISLIDYDFSATPQHIKDHALVLGNVDSSLIISQGVLSDDIATVVDEYEYSLTVPYTNYLDTWVDSYVDLTFAETSLIIDGTKSVVQTYSSYTDGLGINGDKIFDLNERKTKFPFAAGIVFTTEGKTTNVIQESVADTIGSLDLFSTWTSHVLSSLDPFTFSVVEEEEVYEFSAKTYYNMGSEQELLNASPTLFELEAGSFDGDTNTNSFSHMLFEDSSEATSENAFASRQERMFLDTVNSPELQNSEALYEDYQTGINDMALLTGLAGHNNKLHTDAGSFERTVASQDGRIYNGLFNRGDYAESQTVGYRVRKYRGPSVVGAHIQEMWIPNALTNESLIEYIDTQVRYGEQYTYDIHAYKYVFGTKYKYEEVEAPNVKQIEEVFSGDGQIVGYNFRWFGAKNLFDVASVSGGDEFGPTLPEPGRVGAQVWELVASFLSQESPLRNTISRYSDYANSLNGSIFDVDDRITGIQSLETFWIFNHFYDRETYPLRYAAPDSSYNAQITDAALENFINTGAPNYLYGADIKQLPAWSDENVRFFTLGQIKDIMQKAWYTKPTGFHNGQTVTYPSWQEIWGLEWNDNFIQVGQDGQISESDPEVKEAIRRLQRGNVSFQAFRAGAAGDPSALDLSDWFNLFMGFDDGVPEGFIPGNTNPIPLAMSPSHHRLNGRHIPWGSGTNVEPSGPKERVEGLQSTVVFEVGYNGGFYSGIETNQVIQTFVTNNNSNKNILPGVSNDETSFGIAELAPGEGLPILNTIGYGAKYRVRMLPSTRIVEVPIGSLTTSVLSNPPPPPEIEILPYRGVNDKLLFTFDATFSEVLQVAIPITQEDRQLFDKHYQAQAKEMGQEILFKSDDVPTFFEVFRTETAPTSYSDFDEHLRARVPTLISSEGRIIRSRSADYVDAMQANVKYYYTFRTVDFHGNVSNPTFIYEVELVDDGGAIYPLINLYTLPIVESKVASKDMKKLIQVYPVLDRVTPNVDQNFSDSNGNTYSDPNDVPEIQLGVQGTEPVWGKTFKIRLTSKKTGKKIDMNLTFNKKDERN
jgi:hypothetical protein